MSNPRILATRTTTSWKNGDREQEHLRFVLKETGECVVELSHGCDSMGVERWHQVDEHGAPPAVLLDWLCAEVTRADKAERMVGDLRGAKDRLERSWADEMGKKRKEK